MGPRMREHWRNLANTTEFVFPSPHPSPQPKRQIDRFIAVFVQLTADTLQLNGRLSPKIADSHGRSNT